MESIWREQTKKIIAKADNVKSEYHNMHWDVIVVGAGMAGLLIAYYLQEKGNTLYLGKCTIEKKFVLPHLTKRSYYHYNQPQE